MALPFESLEEIGGGAYADVHRIAGGRVLKIARATPREVLGVTNGVFFAQGKYFATGSVGVFHPDANDVLDAEIAQLSKIDHEAFPKVLEEGTYDGRRFFVMPHLSGKTWRDAIYLDESIGVQEIARLARILADVRDVLPVHGDLKPDNLLFAEDGTIHVLDPSSGSTKLGPGGVPLQMVLTDWYNPDLSTSDLPALGMLLIEAVTKQHLWLAAGDHLPPKNLGPDLEAMLHMRGVTGGLRMISRVRHLPLPSELDPTISPKLEAVALKCLSLVWDGSHLETTAPFEDVTALAAALD